MSKKLIEVNAKNPCRHCGKPDWCYRLLNVTGGETGLEVCRRNDPAEGWIKTSKTDREGNFYLKKVGEEEKTANVIKETEYLYTGRDGKPRAKAVRRDFSNGRKSFVRFNCLNGKWETGDRSSIPVYNYPTVKKAIEDKRLVFVVEGEQCADYLISLGLVATTIYGGCKGLVASDLNDLKGANLVLVPDRDVPGVHLMDEIASHFPESQWLYCDPESELWDKEIPPDNGVDVIDWAESTELNKKLILSLIEPRRRKLNCPQLTKETKEKVEKIKKERENLTVDECHDRVEEKIKENLPKSQIIAFAKKLYLENNCPLTDKDLEELVKVRKEEIVEQEYTDEEFATFAEKLKNQKINQIKLSDIFCSQLAVPLAAKANNLKVDELRFLTYLFPLIGACVGSNVYVQAKQEDDWKEFLTFLTIDVAPPSDGKTVSQKAILDVLTVLQKQEEARYLLKLEEYEQLCEEWADLSKGEKQDLRTSEKNPRVFKKLYLQLRKFVFNSGTFEAIIDILGKQSYTTGTLLLRDELSGLFASFNQYKQRGDDRQKVLEFYNGALYTTVDFKTEGKSSFLNGQTISITGGIQPHVITECLNLEEDPDGMAARFLYYCPKLHEDFESFTDEMCDISKTLKHLVTRLLSIQCPIGENNLPDRIPMNVIGKARDLFVNFYGITKSQIRKNRYLNPSLASYYGKLLSYALRIAGAIHLVDWAFDQERSVDLEYVSESAMFRALLLVQLYLDEFCAICTKNQSRESLDGIYGEIWMIIETFGSINQREICRKFQKRNFNGRPLKKAEALFIMKTMAERGYGRLGEGKDRETLYSLDLKTQRLDVPSLIPGVTFQEKPAPPLPPPGTSEVNADTDFILGLVEALQNCEDKEMMRALRQDIPGVTPATLRTASARLSPEKRAQIKGWVLQLNREQNLPN